MTEREFRPLNPLTQPDRTPRITNPTQPGPTSADPIGGETFNHPPYDSFLSRGSKRLHTAYIVVDDIIPGGEYKRYQRFVQVHREQGEQIGRGANTGIELNFIGKKPSIHSLGDIGEGSAAADAIDLLNKTLQGEGNPIHLDTFYTIELLPLQCERVCVADSHTNQRFNFNNGGNVTKIFPCTVHRNLYVAFDVINNGSFPIIVRFDVKVLMLISESASPRAPESNRAASQQHMPIGRASSARPNGASGTVPVGEGYNALDVLSE